MPFNLIFEYDDVPARDVLKCGHVYSLGEISEAKALTLELYKLLIATKINEDFDTYPMLEE